MQPRPRFAKLLFLQAAILAFSAFGTDCLHADQTNRRTALVNAVESCKQSVVNLRGRKTVRETTDAAGNGQEVKHVNGMGTGVVIDSRGYILTNYHVVQDVREIKVTTGTNETTTARLIAHDRETDLAILKIETKSPLPVINIGTSTDLMLAETVAAVGNAYGYEHTVTVGIISQLGRTVQVNETQVYRNLIQTDASINPGNSGGPLLNLDGEMIGINVAVRVGAQGIAFAIPVNDALEVAARMVDDLVAEHLSHGLKLQTVYLDNLPQVLVASVDPSSAAAAAGIAKGDRLIGVDGVSVNRALDFQRALLGRTEQGQLNLNVIRGGKENQVALALEKNRRHVSNIAWNSIGIRLTPTDSAEMHDRHPNYQSGLKVTKVRAGSPAQEAQIMEGDILVAMHGWKTESLENLAYVLQQPDLKSSQQVLFYILRDREPFYGQMRVASAAK